MTTPFKAISVFYHVATLNSVSAAAEELGVTPSAISQQMRALEERVGTRLITRVGRKIRLTEAGERYFEQISDHVHSIIRSTEAMRGARTNTLLTIRATPTIATKWLLPRLPRFLSANSDIDIRLDGTNEPTDFNRDLVDLEIRHGIGRWPGLHCEPLVEERFLPVCSPKLADPYSIDARDILKHCLIHSVKAQIQWKTWLAHLGLSDDLPLRRLYFDRSHMTVEAAVLGLGIALESNLMMEQELCDRRLIIPVQQIPEMLISTQWIVLPHQNQRRQRVRRFLDWLRDEAQSWHRAQPSYSSA